MNHRIMKFFTASEDCFHKTCGLLRRKRIIKDRMNETWLYNVQLISWQVSKKLHARHHTCQMNAAATRTRLRAPSMMLMVLRSGLISCCLFSLTIVQKEKSLSRTPMSCLPDTRSRTADSLHGENTLNVMLSCGTIHRFSTVRTF